MKGSNGKRIVMAMAVWVCLLGVFLARLEVDTGRDEERLARTTANAFFQQILISRQWNASHGGVYVPITATTLPNIHLPLANRDLTASNGVQLTKVNPSYMTRQIAELAQKNRTGIQFHITSLKPIRPENRPAPWEERWLISFAQGVKEQGEFVSEGDTLWYRYMAPLFTGPECLACHARQGYKEGDIRGGLSVSLPYPPHTHVALFVGFSLAGVIGLLVIFISGTLYEQKRLLFAAIFDNTIPTCVTDGNHTVLMANDSYWREFGPLPKPSHRIKCHEHRPGPSCHTEGCPLTRIMAGESRYVCETGKEKEGVAQHFIVTARPLLDSGERVVGIVESFQEITLRKRAEKALEESNRKLEALSTTDGLTGIANRRYFDQVLAQEHARHARSGAALSLILLDIDLFKAFNDCYGHVLGDECLRRVARVIAACAARPADLAARYGGEEFASILPETDLRGAVAIAERIRQGIIALAIPHQGSQVAGYVTASLGVVTVSCRKDGVAMEIVDQVDKLLYRAKAAGRNRVESAAIGVDGDGKGALVRLVWRDSFACGNPLLDAQHHALFDTANQLLAAILSGLPAPEIAAMISGLLDQLSQHFVDEERILGAAGFPGLQEHAAEHAQLLAQGRELSLAFTATTLTVGAVVEFLVTEVVMRHMVDADLEYPPFLNQDASAESPTAS
jgi:diguanylate cyclase (GGDEF)-like protein/hemerythrin-like metal-binding protein